MRTRTPHVRRGASPRRGRSTRARERATSRRYPTRRQGRVTSRRSPARHHGRAMTRQRPASRRAGYGRAPAPRMGLGKALLVAAGAVVVAAALAVAVLLLITHRIHLGGPPGNPLNSAPAVAQLVYTERTANDAAITLPDGVHNELYQNGLKHQSIQVIKVGFTGHTYPSHIDMTPRTGNSPNDPVLKVGIGPAINAKISTIEGTINSAPAGAPGGRALFAGLTKIDFTGVPVTIISSGLDLANPDNFRSLNWHVPAGKLVADIRNGQDLPALRGPVTFVLVPTAGAQPQLGQAQKTYLKGVWRSLLTAAGATSVTFVDAISAPHSSPAPTAPTVPVPPQVGTPGGGHHGQVTCTVPDSRFILNKPELVDPAQTEQDLTPCIQAALAVHASFALDGWTAYKGPLNADGKPAKNYPWNRQLSQNRVRTIESLLINDLGVPISEITRATGHGDFNQPYPDPRSHTNRVVVITYTVK
jgi:hypothetical protein